MTISSQRFNSIIEIRRALREYKRIGISKGCPECSKRIEDVLQKMKDNLEDACLMGMVKP